MKHLTANSTDSGNLAEKQALSFLLKHHLELIERNYSWRGGEIDLIMQDENCLVFVEVRMRNNGRFGTGADTVGPRKMRKIASTAEHYLANHEIPRNLDCRFDVISIDERIDWIQNAFTLDSIM